MKEMDDTNLVSRSFLQIFFLDINNLKDALAGYRSIILRLNIKNQDNTEETLKGLTDEMKNSVIAWSDEVRTNVERCQISAEAIQQINKDIKTENLRKHYEKIIETFAPDLEDVSKYTFEINKIFVKGTIEKILNKMESFYDQFSTK